MRRKKHGIVTDGVNTTMYGRDAQNFMVEQTALYTFTQREAYERMRNASKMDRPTLARALKKQGFKVQKRWDPDV